MTIADQINRLNNAKAAIKESIENKGVSVSDSAKLDEYPALIDSIEVGSGGGGGDSTYVNPDFYEARTAGGTDYYYLFYSAKQVPDNLGNWDTSKAINMDFMFQNCSGLEMADLSNWDVSNVTTLNNIFRDCKSLTTLNLSNWNLTKATNLQALVYGCTALTTLNFNNFNTSNITKINSTFRGCTALTTLDLSSFDTSNVTDMGYMFYGDKALTTITGELDLSGLTDGFYPGSYSHPTKGCTALETLYLKNIYKNCTMTNASKWSINLGDTKIKDECLLYIINELPDLKNDKGLTATDKIVFTLPKTNTLTQEQVQVAIDKGWSVANTTY